VAEGGGLLDVVQRDPPLPPVFAGTLTGETTSAMLIRVAAESEHVEASPAVGQVSRLQPVTLPPAVSPLDSYALSRAVGNRAMAAMAAGAAAGRPLPSARKRGPQAEERRFRGAEHLLARAVQERRVHDGPTARVLARTCDPTVSNCGDRNDPRNYVSFEDFRAGAAAPYSDEALREMWDQAHARPQVTTAPVTGTPVSSSSGPAASTSSSAPARSPAGSVRLNVRVITDAEARGLGVTPTALPENTLVPVPAAPLAQSSWSSGPSIVAPAGAGAAYFAPSPFSFIPPNSTGVLWTQGHTSIFTNPETALLPTLRGYRGNLGYYLAETVPGVGRQFTIRLHEGVPGSFANDAAFPLMPGQQNYLYVTRDAEAAAQFATRLRSTEYGGQYTYSPPRAAADPILGPVGASEAEIYEILVRRGQAPMCTNNCITLPAPEIQGAIGTRPTTTSGVDVISGQGPSGVDPHYAGRGRLMTEAMSSGPIPEGVQRLRVTPGGGNAMFVVRGGGTILLVYGIYHTEERVRAAVGTPQLETVVAEETGSWIGGILGSALGGAAAGAILCAPTGPIDAVCVVGGFAGGLVLGMAGSAVGSEVGHTAVQGRPPEGGVIDTVTAPIVDRAARLHNYLEYEIRKLYGVPF
jgi:hypothetical protein